MNNARARKLLIRPNSLLATAAKTTLETAIMQTKITLDHKTDTWR
jgi:hypothetical protein